MKNIKKKKKLCWEFPGGPRVHDKEPPAIQKMQVRSLAQEDPPKKATATRSSVLAWRIPWQRSLVGYSPWSQGRKESGTTEAT